MKTLNTTANEKQLAKAREIVETTLAEFKSDERAEISECALKAGCVRDLDGAPVFEALARIQDCSLRSLGNAYGWILNGRDAALAIANNRVWDAMIAEDEDAAYEDASQLVDKALQELAA
jgi:hypothetical protein